MASPRRKKLAAAQAITTAQDVLDAIAQPIIVLDTHDAIERVNPAAAALFGHSTVSLLGRDLSGLIPNWSATNDRDCDESTRLIDESPTDRVEGARVQARRLDGSPLVVRIVRSECVGPAGRFTVLAIQDVTNQEHEVADLMRYIQDLESARAQSETQAVQVVGLLEELATEKEKLENQKELLRENENELQSYIRDLEMTRSQFEKQARRMVHLAEKLYREKEQVRNSRRIIQHQASHDPLTDLGNRALLSKILPAMMADARATGTKVGLIYLDLDNFKMVNDRLGHEAGDSLLRKVADALRSSIRAEDEAIRHGGDEFTIVVRLNESRTEASLVELADRLCDALTIPVNGPDFTIQISASIGIALFPDHGEEVDAILTAADAAMYRAKRAGKGRIAS